VLIKVSAIDSVFPSRW